MRRLLSVATAFVVVGSVLAAGLAFSAGTWVTPARAQEQSGDANGNGCIDERETPVWNVTPRRLAGPPAELADPAGPPTDVGPSLYEFTLSEGEVYLAGCEADDEEVLVLDGALTLTIFDTEPQVANYVTFTRDGPAGQCEPLENDPTTCRFEQSATVTLASGDVVYHTRGARYAYRAAAGEAQEATPSARTSPTEGVAAGGVRAAAAPLAQTGARFQIVSKGSKPRGCGGDCN